MASLQTLRNKGGVIVAVIIGVALLAFVLGDMLTSGSTLFGSSANDVGQIDSHDVSGTEYGSQINYLTEIQKISSGTETMSDEQSQALQTQAWEQLVRKYAVDPALESVGITVTDAEMAELMSGRYLSPIVEQVFANPQTGMFDAAYLRQFIENMDADKTGRMQMFWDYLQSEVQAQTLIMKFKTLIDKSVYVTQTEADLMARLESNTYSVRFVAQNYNKIADSTITVSTADAKAFYEKNKAMFERTTSRSIDFVVFEALPSEADYAAADKYINELASELTASQNVKQFVSLNSQEPFDSRYYKEGELVGALGDFAFTATTEQIYGPELTGDQYTLARVSDIRVLPDSVNFSHIVVTDKKMADSLKTALNGQAAEQWAAAAAQYSLDTQSGAKAGLIGTVDPQTLGAEFAEPLYTTPTGAITVVNTPNAIHIIKVNSRIGEGRKVQLGTINYKIEASKETRNVTFSNANDFEKSVRETSFADAVAAGSLAKRTMNLGANDRSVQGLGSSRELVRWAYNSKQGENSKIMEFGDNFVVASLTTIIDQGVAPFDAVEKDAAAMVRRQKKGEILAAKMTGASSLESLAASVGDSIITAGDISFNTFIAPEVGYDPAFAGGVCGSKEGQLSKPIVGMSAVYVAQIVGQTASPVPQQVEREKLTAEREQSAFVSVYQTLMEKSRIVDQRYKFY